MLVLRIQLPVNHKNDWPINLFIPNSFLKQIIVFTFMRIFITIKLSHNSMHVYNYRNLRLLNHVHNLEHLTIHGYEPFEFPKFLCVCIPMSFFYILLISFLWATSECRLCVIHEISCVEFIFCQIYSTKMSLVLKTEAVANLSQWSNSYYERLRKFCRKSGYKWNL